MKTVILAGGYGTRISEESHTKPKPMIEIGGMPILWHLMKIYSGFDYNEFIICAGYKQNVIKDFFANYFLYTSDVTFDLHNNRMEVHKTHSEDWKVTVVDTGLDTMTGGRIKRIKKYVGNEPFFLTYGDGLSDVDMNRLLEFHKSQGKIVTLTSIQPSGRFGVIDVEQNLVQAFREKNSSDMGWINGGFMVVNPEIFDYIEDDGTVFERDVLEKLAAMGEVAAYKHYGFWKCMDTLRDKNELEQMWNSGQAPWKA